MRLDPDGPGSIGPTVPPGASSGTVETAIGTIDRIGLRDGDDDREIISQPILDETVRWLTDEGERSYRLEVPRHHPHHAGPARSGTRPRVGGSDQALRLGGGFGWLSRDTLWSSAATPSSSGRSTRSRTDGRARSRRADEATCGFVDMLLKLLTVHRQEHLAVILDVSGDRGTFGQIYPGTRQSRRLGARPGTIAASPSSGSSAFPSTGAGLRAGRRHRDDRPEDASGTRQSRSGSCRRTRTSSSCWAIAFAWSTSGTRSAGDLEADKGIRPDQVVDMLALMGDTVDNVPGVAGIGRSRRGPDRGTWFDRRHLRLHRRRGGTQSRSDRSRGSAQNWWPPATTCRSPGRS